MSCFPCFSSNAKKASRSINARNEHSVAASRGEAGTAKSPENPKVKASTEPNKKDSGNGNIAAQIFTFRELASATNNFRAESLVGEGGFGRVYKGQLENTGQLVAVKQLDRNGLQGNKEFLVEVLMLSLLHHQNLVNLVGYCADGDQRLLVYEFMPLGSLEDHLLDLPPGREPLDWYTRMKIASGAAQGLEYLHDKANPPVIYRDLKSSNILLDEEFNPKLSDFGLAKLGPVGDKEHVSSRVMGTYGYCAPEYARSGELTSKSDVYSFGVVLLELITGRRAIDTTRATDEQNLVAWAQPRFKNQTRFKELVDPLLEEKCPVQGLNQAVGVAAMCLQDEAMVRPLMADVVVALSFLMVKPTEPEGSSLPHPHAQSTIPTHEEGAYSDQMKHEEGACSDQMKHEDGEEDDEEEDSDEEDEEAKEEEEESVKERQRAVAEAIEWGSNSRRSRQSHESSSP